MTTQETAHAIAALVGLPMIAVMILERAQRPSRSARDRRPSRSHHYDPNTYKIARHRGARATTNNNKKGNPQ